MIVSKDISIVVQGPIGQGNIVDIVNVLSIYRDVFPDAELVCSISSSDIFKYGHDDFSLISKFKDDHRIRSSISKMKSLGDKFVFCSEALPLSPLKNGTGVFNGNYQIEAAQKGLSICTRKYVLRIRNDMVFLSSKIIDFYFRYNGIERGEYKVFKNPVLISSAFTLNPFAIERFPFHWSDWFHFGLTTDVVDLWNVPFMSERDLLFFKVHPHPVGSNEYERTFFARYAIEQHINFSFFRNFFNNIKLDHLNDCSSIDDSINILRDNFIVCDPYAIDLVFDKYFFDVNQRYMQKYLITNNLWEKLFSTKSYKDLLTISRDGIFLDKNEEFPRTYLARDLYTKVGIHNNNRIILKDFYGAESSNGVVVFGPHSYLPMGYYEVFCFFDSFEASSGSVHVQITLEEGKIILFSSDFDINNIELNGSKKILNFFFENKTIFRDNFELVINLSNVESFSFEKFTINRILSPRNIEVSSSKRISNFLNYQDLPVYLKFFLGLQYFFLDVKKKEKMKYRTYLFLKDSDKFFNKIIFFFAKRYK